MKKNMRPFLMIVLLAAVLAWPARMQAATVTGWISSGSTCHLVVPSGQTGTATISWGTSRTTTAQVWYSVNGGPLALFDTRKSGTAPASFISSDNNNFYVFKLFKGTGTNNADLLAWTSVTTQPPPNTIPLVNYFPYNSGNEIFYNANWTTNRSIVEKDLDHMSSLSVRAIRLLMRADVSGMGLWWQTPNPSNPNYSYTWHLGESTNNIREFLSLCAARDIKVVVAFWNFWLTVEDNNRPGHQMWENYFDSAHFQNFIDYSKGWINAYVNSIESSPWKQTVIYYDYQNEMNQWIPNGSWYATSIYDGTTIPMGKRGFSVLIAGGTSDSVVPLKTTLAGRRIDYLSFHVYQGMNEDVALSYNQCKSKFSDTTAAITESGLSLNDGGTEADQSNFVMSKLNTSINLGIPYFGHWSFWDKFDGLEYSLFGWGYSPHEPRDVMGAISSRLNLLQNPDFELFTGNAPNNWAVGGSMPATLIAAGPDWDQATGHYFGRVEIAPHNPGYVWLTTDLVPVTGTKKLFVNGYLRSTMNYVDMRVAEFTSNFDYITTTAGPGFTSPDWTMRNYLHDAGSWNLNLQNETAYIQVQVVGVVPDIPYISYLDVDTVSASRHQ
jgi:hypothetical protein